MNNSKFMELSNEEVMEVEGGCKTCRKVGKVIGYVLALAYDICSMIVY